MKRWGCAFACVLAVLAGRALAAGLAIDAAYLYQPPPGQTNAAIYMELHNRGSAAAVIVGARVEGAASAAIHGHEHAEGMMRMVAVPRLEVPPGGRVSLRSGGYHLMVMGLQGAPLPGATLPFCLRLDGGVEQCAEAQIRELGE